MEAIAVIQLARQNSRFGDPMTFYPAGFRFWSFARPPNAPPSLKLKFHSARHDTTQCETLSSRCIVAKEDLLFIVTYAVVLISLMVNDMLLVANIAYNEHVRYMLDTGNFIFYWLIKSWLFTAAICCHGKFNNFYNITSFFQILHDCAVTYTF